MKLLALSLLCACIGQSHWPEALSPLPSAGGHRISAITEVTDELKWRASPWYRQGDLMLGWPVFLAIDGTNAACIIPGSVWALAQVGQFVRCDSAWRLPRP